MIMFVSVRAYAKLWIMRKVTWDDRTPYRYFSPSLQQLISATVTCLIGFVCITRDVLPTMLLIADFRQLLTVTYYATCVRGLCV